MSEEDKKYEEAAQELRKAMEGIGTDEDTLIKVVIAHKTAERLKIKEAYQKLYSKDLIEDLKSELSGKFEDAMIALYTEPIQYDAECLHKAIAGAGTDENTLIEIISSRPSWILKKIKTKYDELYKKSLVDDVKGDTSGDFQTLLVALLENERNESKEINKEECEQKAKELFETKEKGWDIKNNDCAFSKFFIFASPTELSLIARDYYKLSGESINDAIDKKFSGDMKDLLKAVLYSKVSPSEYFATRVYKAIEGFGTDNRSLIRILITRSEVDIPFIKRYYRQLYSKSMVEDVKNDISGDYQKLLIQLIE